MSDFKTEYPVLYFNEYFRRKPIRLSERESEELFTLEETDVNNFEYISLHDHEKEIASLKEQLKEAEWVLVKFVPHKDTIQWDSREKLARDYFKRATQARREK